jgi:hypothetical protein
VSSRGLTHYRHVVVVRFEKRIETIENAFENGLKTDRPPE